MFGWDRDRVHAYIIHNNCLFIGVLGTTVQSGTCVVVWFVIRVQNLDHLSLLFARSSCYCCRLRVPRFEVNNLLLILFLSLSFCCCWFLLR